jgi:hypothetical protein
MLFASQQTSCKSMSAYQRIGAAGQFVQTPNLSSGQLALSGKNRACTTVNNDHRGSSCRNSH